MATQLKADLCVIGAGSGGLSVAAGAAQMGAEVVLIEQGKMGGDCLNYGCVPSKALIAAASAAEAVRRAPLFGIEAGAPKPDFAAIHRHVHDVIAGIAPHDSQERFEGLGVTVIRAPAQFTGRRTVEAGGFEVHARRFVVATGSSPAVPAINGLNGVPYLTNETIFDQTECPSHLIVIGGGPIGAELAQAHRRLGADVTVLEMSGLLGKDDGELSEVVRESMLRDGVKIFEGIEISRLEKTDQGIAVAYKDGGAKRRTEGSHLLIATGRTPNVAGLRLDKAGINHGRRGIEVDGRLRTSNKRVFAIGDVAGKLQFTHVAGYHAGIVIRNALFHLPARARAVVPWVTYTAPALAQVGMTEADARADARGYRVLRAPFSENDRARTGRETEGLVKIITNKRGKILGAGIVGPQAGELIQPWVLAMSRGLKIGAMAGMVAPYPTLGEASKRAAGAFFAPALFGPRTRRIVRLLRRFG